MTRGVLAKTEPSRRCQISLFGARQKRLHQPTTGCCTHEARRKNSTLSVASLTGKKGARHAFGVDDEDDSPFVAGLKAWFMGWVSFSRAHLPKSGSFLMSAEELDHVPHDILRDAFTPHLSRPGNCSKDPSLRHPGCYYPLIECRFDPLWNGHRADVAALANQVYHRPVPLAHLDFIQLQAHKFRSAKTTTKQQGQHGVVALRSHAISTSTLEYFRTLLCAQPITRAKPELLDSFHSADPRSQLGTQQARVGGLVC